MCLDGVQVQKGVRIQGRSLGRFEDSVFPACYSART